MTADTPEKQHEARADASEETGWMTDFRKCAPASGEIGFQLEGAPFELRNVQIQSTAESAPLIVALPVRD